MKALVIDTSTQVLSLSLFEGGLLRGHLTLQARMQHGETLVPAISQLLAVNQWQAKDLDQLYIGRGPGSYTGLRIGVTLAKTWGASHNLPVYSLSSLALLASQALPALRARGQAGYVIPLMDARRGTVYTNAYYYNPLTECLTSQAQDRHIDWGEWVEGISQPEEVLAVVGEDLSGFLPALREYGTRSDLMIVAGNQAYPNTNHYANVETILEEDIHTLTPHYAHATLAEQEWAQREGTQVADDRQNEAYITHYSSQDDL